MNKKIQRISIKGVICRDKKIFMLKDSKGNWELPGGKIDFGEHPQETLKREIKEELGISKICIGVVINVWDFLVTVDNNSYQFIIIVYECDADLSNLKISDEHLEYKWVSLNEMDGLMVRDGYKETINKFIKLKNIKI